MKASDQQASSKKANGGRVTSRRSTKTARAATTAPDPTGLLKLQHVVGNRAARSLLDGGHFEQTPEVRPVLHLQRTLGNQAVQRMLQTKLAINTPGDNYEQEADRVSEQIMRMPEPCVQRKCACGIAPQSAGECEECGKKPLSVQRMSLDAAGPVAGGFAPPIVHGPICRLERDEDG